MLFLKDQLSFDANGGQIVAHFETVSIPTKLVVINPGPVSIEYFRNSIGCLISG